VHAILCPRLCVAACRGRATHGEAACPRFAALRGRAGTASLYINRGRYVHAILCPRPCVAAEPQPPPRVCRTRQSRVSACRGEAALRLIDPRKLYSILRPRSINRLIVNNPNIKQHNVFTFIHVTSAHKSTQIHCTLVTDWFQMSESYDRDLRYSCGLHNTTIS